MMAKRPDGRLEVIVSVSLHNEEDAIPVLR